MMIKKIETVFENNHKRSFHVGKVRFKLHLSDEYKETSDEIFGPALFYLANGLKNKYSDVSLCTDSYCDHLKDYYLAIWVNNYKKPDFVSGEELLTMLNKEYNIFTEHMRSELPNLIMRKKQFDMATDSLNSASTCAKQICQICSQEAKDNINYEEKLNKLDEEFKIEYQMIVGRRFADEKRLFSDTTVTVENILHALKDMIKSARKNPRGGLPFFTTSFGIEHDNVKAFIAGFMPVTEDDNE